MNAPRPKVTTPAGEVLSWLSGPTHKDAGNCGGCQVPLAAVAIVKLAYTFRSCECGTPEYPHLVEQLWHREHLPRSGPDPRVEALREAAEAVSRRAGTMTRSSRQVHAEVADFLRGMARQENQP